MGDLAEPPSGMPGNIACGTEGFLAEVTIAVGHLGIGELDPVSAGISGRGSALITANTYLALSKNTSPPFKLLTALYIRYQFIP